MVKGNGRPCTGTARELFTNGKIPDSLRARSEQYDLAQIKVIVGDPRLLVEQTREWVDANASIHPDLVRLWAHHVQQFSKTASTILQRHLANTRGFSRNTSISLKFTGRGVIYLAYCPLCEAKCVKLEVIQPEDFKPLSLFGRLVNKRPCDHRLPISTGFWQFLLNVDNLSSQSELGDELLPYCDPEA